MEQPIQTANYLREVKYSTKKCSKCNEKLYNVTNPQLAFHDDMYICKNCDKSFHDAYYYISQKEDMTKKEMEEFDKKFDKINDIKRAILNLQGCK